MLSPESSASPGRWRTSNREYQRGFMDAVSDPNNREVVGVFASQTGKTDCVLNVIGYHIQHDPSPILLIQPTDKMAEAWSKDRLAPFLRDTPCMEGKIASARSRDSGNTILHKSFPGGHLTITGANSPASLASRPIRVLLCDEVDRYPPSAGSEGDPVRLASTRTSAFWNSRKVYISSPGRKGVSRMERLWERSDQRRFFVPCPDCGTHQALKWSQVQWDKDENGQHLPETAIYACERCGSAWSDAQRWAAVRKGEWRPTAPFRGIAGFHVNALAAQMEDGKLRNLVDEWLEAQGNPQELMRFVNTRLAEWWTEEGETVDETGLLARREDYEALVAPGCDLPDGVAVLTAGIDVQKDRLEYEITGWGRAEESWLVRYGRIYGDPKQDPAVLDELDQVLRTPLVHARGVELYIRAACIDTGGHATQTIYRWVRPRLRRPLPDGRSQFVFGIKGRSEPGRPVWPEKASRDKRKVRIQNLWVIGVDAAKDQIYGRLGIAEPGPGHCHFPRTVGEDYFKGLTAEHVRTVFRRGRPVRVWEERSPGAPNEPLDCRVYSYAALEGLRSPPFLLNLEREVRRIEALSPREPAPGSPSPVVIPNPSSLGNRRRRRVRSGGVER